MVVITLKSLPSLYEHFIETINITSTDVDLKFSDLCNKLLQQNRWRQQFGSSTSSPSIEQAFSAKSSAKNKGKAQSSQPKGLCSSQDKKKKKNIQCNYCHKFGHMKAEGRIRLAFEQKKQGGSQQKANVVEHSEQKESTFYAFMAKRTTNPVHSYAWYVDSRDLGHFTHRRDWFTKFEPFSDLVIFRGGEEYIVVSTLR